MRDAIKVCSSIPAIIRNDAGLYEGDLVSYFRAIVNHAENLHNPYHNFGHPLHVVWLCHDACIFYSKTGVMLEREMRNLLIAGMVHDVNHTTIRYPDSANIARAVAWLKEHIALKDKRELGNIATIVRASEYPYLVPSEMLTLSAQILRDADAAQTFSPAWIQQVVFGLAAEWKKTPLEILRDQLVFLQNLKFHTAWAQQRFPTDAIREKIAETQELINLLEE